MVSAKIEKSIHTANHIVEIAKRENNQALLLQGYAGLCNSFFWAGNYRASTENLKKGLEMYHLQSQELITPVNHCLDPYCLFVFSGSVAAWICGDEALAAEIIATAKTRLDTDVVSKGFILLGIAWYYFNRRQAKKVEHYSLMVMHLARDNDIGDILALAKIKYGWALSQKNMHDDALNYILSGMDELKLADATITYSHDSIILAEVYVKCGRLDDALLQLDKGIERALTSEAKVYHSELYRLKAELLSSENSESQLVKKLLDESMRLARQQGALAFIERLTQSNASFMESALCI
ncbi:MAG: hypothetical protein HRT88_02090 [Lentisphaeraceae bacterium]|nr:hypothetical protein [Lentisphaeraceae bacterium]